MDAGQLAAFISDASPRAIAATVARLTRTGTLADGARLPTVRALAEALGVSPGTVAVAWRALVANGVVTTSRRGGTIVQARSATVGDYRSMAAPGGEYTIDLSAALPDSALLPNLKKAMRQALALPPVDRYRRDLLAPELKSAVLPALPFEAEEAIAVSGGFEGIMLVASTAFRRGERIAIEDPTAARTLDILSVLGLEAISVACDGNGPRPESLREALRQEPVGFILQPRAQEPAGHVLSRERASALADILRRRDVLVIEDDGKAELSTAEAASIGSFLPHRTVLCRSFSKSHGLDLRVAILAGCRSGIEPARERHVLGQGWTSYLLQRALAFMLTDETEVRKVRAAARTYRERRERLAEALRTRGIRVANRDGLTLWIPVQSEASALMSLAVDGIGVSPGSHFTVRNGAPPHIRVATGRLSGKVEALADRLARAARTPPLTPPV